MGKGELLMRLTQFLGLWLLSGWIACGTLNAFQAETSNSSPAISDSMLPIQIDSPQPHQVIQRKGYVPQFAHSHQPGGAALGYADVEISLDLTNVTATFDEMQYRTTLLPGMQGRPNDWKSVPFTRNQTAVSATARISAGGWYQLEVRCLKNGRMMAKGTIQPVGVGEVFLIAGQSYATNTNDELLKVRDAGQRVSAYNFRSGSWQIANDPQPAADASDGGSIWPAYGDQLVSVLQVPIGLANVAYGGTSSSQWQPGGNLFQPLAETGRNLSSLRAVLWQQGESDVIGKVPVDDYVKNIVTLRDEAAKAWGFSPPWILAKSTLHPTVYIDPAGEGRIRLAMERLYSSPGFYRGPDTDVLDGDNRGDSNSRRHFTGQGQRNAAAMWFAVAMTLINQPRPNHEVVLRDLPELHLLEPAWSSANVHRESSVLIHATDDLPPQARIAFKASEILRVAVANSGQALVEGSDWTLGEDRQTLNFAGKIPFEAITQEQMFPPRDAPHSYRHRTSSPEQNVLYQPGRWFHDHNIEISYHRADVSTTQEMVTDVERIQPEQLKRTLAKMRAGQSLHIAVSGDSISTGLDASSLTFAPPSQPGYAELVAAQLQDSYRCPVVLTNRAVAGWSIANAHQDAESLIAARPDLIVIAYGMNDVGRRDPAWYGEQTRQLVSTFQSRLPDADIILVATMLGNADWVHTPREMFAAYRDQLRTLIGPGVALADLTQVWTILLEHKHDLDLTGNGLNHPNDFGHRLYAQALLALLVEHH